LALTVVECEGGGIGRAAHFCAMSSTLLNATDNLKLLLEAANVGLIERRERVEAWLLALRGRLAEVEEDTEEAFRVIHQLVRLLVAGIEAGRGPDGRVDIRITYRFGPPPKPSPPVWGLCLRGTIASHKLWRRRRTNTVARIVVLDVDGTLMDTNYLHTEAWARAFEEVGHRVPRVELHKQVGKGSDLLIGEFVEDEQTAEKVDELHSEFYGELQVHGHPLPGAKELISALVERGYEVWFVTSAKDEELEHHRSELEAEGRISGVVNSSEVENSKPAPDIFELTLEKADASPDETVAVGDTIWDIESASAVGIRTVAVLTGGAYSEQELQEAGAVEVYENCAALLESGFPD
jgi:HAD superfamily hydrolase (TIGR01509 family)